MAAEKLTSAQLRGIYARAHSLGISEKDNKEDNLHLLVERITGKESIASLTGDEAQSVIRELDMISRPPEEPRKSEKVYTEIPGGATEGQQKKVYYLMYQLIALDREPSTASLGERLCGIISKELKLTASPEKPFLWIDYKAANRLIEMLKRYIKSAEKRRSDG